MNILFVNHAGLTSNSAGHVAFFAQALARHGDACRLAVPNFDEDAAAVGEEAADLLAGCPALGFQETLERPSAFPDGRAADVVHVWTPREHVRKFAFAYLQQAPAARLCIHLEDNERFVTERFTGKPAHVLAELPRRELARLLPAHCAHPRWMEIFLRLADGVTGIVDALRDFAPPGAPFLTLVPGVDFSLFSPGSPDAALRAELGLRADEKVLVYTGNSHPANHGELLNLYRAVALLNNARGVPCRLLRTGRDTGEDAAAFHGADWSPFVRHLGVVEKARLPALLRLADVLVQPGGVNDFNRYRLPSKLPEFLAIGRPTILPACNVAAALTEGEDALFLRTGLPDEIAAACLRVFTNPKLAAILAANGAAHARRLFDGAQAVATLRDFYAARCEAPANRRLRCLQHVVDATSAAGEARLLAELLRVEFKNHPRSDPSLGGATTDGEVEILLNELVAASATGDPAEGDAAAAPAADAKHTRCEVFFGGHNGTCDECAPAVAHFTANGRWRRLVVESSGLPLHSIALPIRIAPTERPGVIEIAGMMIRAAADDRTLLWQARAGSEALSQIRVAGTGELLPHPRGALRVFNYGRDPQLFLPELDGAIAGQPLELILWMRVETDLKRVGEILREPVVAAGVRTDGAALHEIERLAATVKTLEAAYATELHRRRALQGSLAWRLTLPLQKALRLVAPSRAANNGNGQGGAN